MQTQAQASPAIPAHIPPELVLPWAFGFGKRTELEPFSALVPGIHQGPPIFYALDAYPGATPAWVIRRTQDMRHVYMDTEHFSNRGYAPFAASIGESWGLVPSETDPPMHMHYRTFANPLFTPKATERLETQIRGVAQGYIEKIEGRSECDFLRDFALEFPIKVFLDLMGLPLEKTKLFLQWESGLIHSGDFKVVSASTRSVVDYLRGEIDARRKNPTDDFLSFGVKGRILDRPLTDDELIGFAFNLFIGGLDTVTAHMAMQFRYLAENPGQQRFLRENPDRIPDAIEELMRAFGGSNTYRICCKETTLCGQTILPGDKIAMMVSLAGRDPEEYDRPNEIDFDRKPKHVSFAYGPHLCIGIHLARRELRIGMEEFLKAIPEFTIKPGSKITTILSGVVQPASLPLVWR